MDLAYAVEANMADWVLAKASCSNDVELHLDGDASWTFTHAAAPDNTVVQARFSEGNVGVRVAEILDYHRQYKVACDWITGPMSQPASLGAVLRRAGFKCMIHCAGMFATYVWRLKGSPHLAELRSPLRIAGPHSSG